ncbi:MAG: hypothetical protein HRT82_06895 [Henriciella sp.]|nr:hypothetical protein [Henriciella sp.]
MNRLNVTVLAMLSAFAVAAPVAEAKTCYQVDTIRYKNSGAYTVDNVYIMYKDEDGKTQSKQATYDNIDTGYMVKIVLETESQNLKQNTEVWAKIDILHGDNEGCRKDGTKFYYNKSGGTVTYETEGTTYNNNRCTLRNRPSDSHIIDCP